MARCSATFSCVIRAIALFFAFGTAMSGLTAFLLAFPGTPADAVWRLKPAARTDFLPLGGWAILLMLVVCAACATACVGLWRHRIWGQRVAIVILAVNLAGDTMNAALTHDWRTLIGLPIGGAMIAYLIARRDAFQRKHPTSQGTS
jgi:hypothetical protein